MSGYETTVHFGITRYCVVAMPINLRKTRALNKQHYIQNRESVKAASRAASCASYSADPGKKWAASRAASRASYSADPCRKRAASRASYSADPDKKKAASRASYSADPDNKKAASRASYSADPCKKRATSWAASRASYNTDPDKKKAASRAASRTKYRVNPDKKKALARMYYVKAARAKVKWYKKYYAKCKGRICASRRGRYVLAEPKPAEKEFYVKEIYHLLLNDNEARIQLMKAYKRQYKSAAKRLPRVMMKAVCRIAAKRLLNKALQLRKEHVGILLKTTRAVNSLVINGRNDFGEGCHTASSEPYFYDSAYQPVERAYAIPIGEYGSCVVANEISSTESECSKRKGKQQPVKWNCSSECKPVTEAEVAAIVHLQQAFEDMQELRTALDTCDGGCPNEHFTKAIATGDPDSEIVELRGHLLVCFNDGGCCSQLRTLRAASTHYSVLRTFLNHVYSAITSHVGVLNRQGSAYL